MVKKKVHISTAKEVEAFYQCCSRFSCEMDLAGGRYYVDAKSILGIFSLNLEMPLELIAHTDDEAAVEAAFQSFILPEEA